MLIPSPRYRHWRRALAAVRAPHKQSPKSSNVAARARSKWQLGKDKAAAMAKSARAEANGGTGPSSLGQQLLEKTRELEAESKATLDQLMALELNDTGASLKQQGDVGFYGEYYWWHDKY